MAFGSKKDERKGYKGLTTGVTGLRYDNTFSWITRWDARGIMVEVRSWLDSALVAQAITENESPVYTYTNQRTALEPGPVGIGCAAKG